jgi:hypothetical protein
VDRPIPPYQELNSQKNLRRMADINWDLWSIREEAKILADFYELPELIGDMDDGLVSTGSIEAGHREAMVEAIQGQKAPQLSLGVGPAPPPADDGVPRL